MQEIDNTGKGTTGSVIVGVFSAVGIILLSPFMFVKYGLPLTASVFLPAHPVDFMADFICIYFGKQTIHVIIHYMNIDHLPMTFTEKVEFILKHIPCGKVTNYGTVAALAGSPRAARQVVRILHTTTVENIPWHRVVNRHGGIAIKDPAGFQEQKMLLAMEGVEADVNGKLNMDKYQWKIRSMDELRVNDL